MGDLEIGEATEEEFVQANELHNSYYGHTRSLDAYSWEFRGPRDRKPLYVVARKHGKVVGTQALIPIELLDQDGLILTAKSEDTLVNPSARGTGAFRHMYREVTELAMDNGIEAIWGFTGQRQAFEKIGFDAPWEVEQLLLPLDRKWARELSSPEQPRLERVARLGGPLLSYYSRVRRSAVARRAHTASQPSQQPSTSLHDLESFPTDTSRFAAEFSEKWKIATLNRSSPYMDWRIQRNPHARARVLAAQVAGRTVGWCLYANENNGMGRIVDLAIAPSGPRIGKKDTHPFRLIDLLLAEAAKRLRAGGSNSVLLWARRGNEFESLLRSRAINLGFLPVPGGQQTSVFLNLSTTQERFARIKSGYFGLLATQGLSG